MFPPDCPALRQVDFATRRLNCNRYRFYEMVRKGILPPGVTVRLGRRIMVNADALEAFIRGGGSPLPGGWKQTAG